MRTTPEQAATHAAAMARRTQERRNAVQTLIAGVWTSGLQPSDVMIPMRVIIASVRMTNQGRHVDAKSITSVLRDMTDKGLLTERSGVPRSYRPALSLDQLAPRDTELMDLRPPNDRRLLRVRVQHWQDMLRQGGRALNDLTTVQRRNAMRMRLMPPDFPRAMPIVVHMERLSRKAEGIGGAFSLSQVARGGVMNWRTQAAWRALLDRDFVVASTSESPNGRGPLFDLVRPFRCQPVYFPGRGELPWWECYEPGDRYMRTARTIGDAVG